MKVIKSSVYNNSKLLQKSKKHILEEFYDF